MLLFVYTTTHRRFVIFTCRYFKLSWNTTALSQSNWRNFSCSSIKVIIYVKMMSELYTIISNKLWDLSPFFGDLHNKWVLASQQKALGPCKCARFRAMQTYRNYIFSSLLTFVSVSESFCIWNISHRMKTLLTRPPIDCFLSKEAWARVSSEVWTTDF